MIYKLFNLILLVDSINNPDPPLTSVFLIKLLLSIVISLHKIKAIPIPLFSSKVLLFIII